MRNFIKYFVIPFTVGYLFVCFMYDHPNHGMTTSQDNSGYSYN